MSRDRHVNLDAQDTLERWLATVPDWKAKRGIFVVVGRAGTGKTYVLRQWAAQIRAQYVNVNLELLKLAFPHESESELSELSSQPNREYTAELLGKAFRALLETLPETLPEKGSSKIVVLDHWELLQDFKVPLEPQSLLGEHAARTGQKFVLVTGGYEARGRFYLGGKDRYGWRRDEAQFLNQYFWLEGA